VLGRLDRHARRAFYRLGKHHYGQADRYYSDASTHQEFNAQYFQKSNAAYVLSQESLTPEMFISVIKDLLYNEGQLQNLSRNIAKMMPHDGAARIAALLLEISK